MKGKMNMSKNENANKNLVAVPEELRGLIGDSILGYLHGRTEARETTLAEDLRVDTDGSVLDGKFLRSLVGSKTLPAGTKGYVFSQPKIVYDKLMWVRDEEYPAPGANVFHTGIYHTFCTVITLEDGTRALAHAFKSVTYEEPKWIAKL
jgi:hypothetical protein